MAQIKKKFIGAQQVDETKILLNNAGWLQALNASSVATNVLQLSAANEITFASVPQVTSDPTQSNDLTRLSYLQSYVSAAVSGATTAVDGVTVKYNGSSQLEAAKSNSEVITLTSGNIASQAFLLSHLVIGVPSSLSVSGVIQTPNRDYAMSVSGSVSQVSFPASGDLASAGAAALVSGDVVVVAYDYLA